MKAMMKRATRTMEQRKTIRPSESVTVILS